MWSEAFFSRTKRASFVWQRVFFFPLFSLLLLSSAGSLIGVGGGVGWAGPLSLKGQELPRAALQRAQCQDQHRLASLPHTAVFVQRPIGPLSLALPCILLTVLGYYYSTQGATWGCSLQGRANNDVWLAVEMEPTVAGMLLA